MEVSANYLVNIIGKQQVELEILREKVRQLEGVPVQVEPKSPETDQKDEGQK